MTITQQMHLAILKKLNRALRGYKLCQDLRDKDEYYLCVKLLNSAMSQSLAHILIEINGSYLVCDSTIYHPHRDFERDVTKRIPLADPEVFEKMIEYVKKHKMENMKTLRKRFSDEELDQHYNQR